MPQQFDKVNLDYKDSGFCFFSPFLSSNSVQAANADDVTINEIAWMGAEDSANDE